MHTLIVTAQLNEDIRVVNNNTTSFLSDIKEEAFTIVDREIFRMYEKAIGVAIPIVDYIIEEESHLSLSNIFLQITS